MVCLLLRVLLLCDFLLRVLLLRDFLLRALSHAG